MSVIRPNRASRSAAVLLAVLGGFAHASDEVVTETRATIALLEKALTSGSFADREAATERLRNDLTISASDLLQLCIETDSPEVRRRAMAIHRDRFFAAPRPAIGVRFDVAGGLPMIEHIYDNFPAAADQSLKQGDIIIAVAGIQLNPMPSLARDELRPLIFSHEPFETVRLTVYRPQGPEAQARLVAEVGAGNEVQNAGITLSDCPEGYDTVETDVQLGEWSMLDTDLPMSDIDRTRAWEALLKRMDFEHGTAIVARDSSAARNVSFHGKVIQALDIRFPFLTRGAYFPPDENPPGFRNQAVIAKQFRNLAIQRAQLRPQDLVNGEPARGVTVETVRLNAPEQESVESDRLARTARDIATTRARILELSRIASEPGTSAADRRVAEEAISELREELQTLHDRLNESAS